MAKAPYTFPHRSRKAMTEYIVNRTARSYDYKSFPFCWNVKVSAEFDGDTLRQHNADLDPALDEAWNEYLEDNPQLFYSFCEDAGRYLTDGEWTSYPGDDQGDWKFEFNGRSGGWLILTKWEGLDATKFYANADEARDLRAAYYDPMNAEPHNIDCWPLDKVKRFYRGLRCADADFTPARASAEVEYQAAFYREIWEEEKRMERDAEIAAYVDEVESSRPDMVPVE